MKVFNNFNLENFNAYNLSSVCSRAYFPDCEADIINVIQKARPIVIGNGNNLILTKQFYKEDFLILNGCFQKVMLEKEIIIAEAGATLFDLSETAFQNNLSGLEIFYDIPSSVGGAVVMNAGTKEVEIKDLLIKVRYLDLVDGKIKEIYKEDIGFEYRNSFFQENVNTIILKVWFKLEKGDPLKIKSKMLLNKEIRWSKQPRDYPNCGSVFKRPPGRFVGPMLDELGLKGFTIGGAKISEKHSGFIVNTGNATGKDILQIIEIVQKKVKEKFGVDLEIEQRII
ncbi:UDP-N-acetylmuramate dehydrogenase [Cecembia lonarensis]|uniref:UDP-N-acetylenolpyruvoylglucosamine reductase n=1 Tax=Cecembia lonarensis (strain CCUG 58316 / KCTC 22772 / LW9) TaxID=1225176 RepID=K1LW17_CECL9|nr:UDP-N-acetylmuramate dehydrogenase [Cecembia lonarensis]EKB48329.1 UDP-N-acetylenolpyruvoylglucosamine reductase [Cecembia lonarensis LW9]